MGGAIVDSGKFDWAQNDKFPALTRPEPAYHGLTFFETFGDMGFHMHTKAVGLRDLGPTMSPTKAFLRSEEHTSELQSLMRISTAGIRLTKKNNNKQIKTKTI